ncbi:MAG: cyclic nucleotide-binding domain-containing protein [Planctomycetia bacterium]|nr:cyclic nucleotide-binding domain-containing protein [Planctomycetia bacterium]
MPFSPKRSDEDIDRLLAIEPFSLIDERKFSGRVTLRGILKNDARIVKCEDGDILVREGDWGNSAFFVISGSVRVEIEPSGKGLPDEVLGRSKPKRKGLFQAIAQLWRNPSRPEVRDAASYQIDPRLGTRGGGDRTRIYLQDVSVVLDKYRTATIHAGQFFGELSALGRTPRTATVFAVGKAELLEIRWQGLRDLMRRDESLQRRIDMVFRERALESFLRDTPMFRHLSEEEMRRLVAEAQFQAYGQYDWAMPFKRLVQAGEAAGVEHEPLIEEEGHYPNGVLLVRSGLARLSQRYHHGHRTVGYLTAGHVYGFEELVEGWRSRASVPLKYSLRAIGNVGVVFIATPLIEAFVLKRSGPAGAGRRARPAAATSSPYTSRIEPDLVEFLVENRFVNGTATMLIDLDRCTRCDDCVRACAAAHDNNPRFLRHGPVHDHIMVANACMHCQDPVCMIECPTGAIHRDLHEGQVVINDQTCIGCGACAKNCPYDAIRMVEIRHASGGFMCDETTHAPIVKATKCDLCVDQWGGPACQRACPHDALVRMDMRKVQSLANWQNR